MSYMFYECSSLKELNLSHFKTKNLKDISRMFCGCSSLKELNLPKFEENNIINMYGMLDECRNGLREKIKDQVENIRNEAFF